MAYMAFDQDSTNPSMQPISEDLFLAMHDSQLFLRSCHALRAVPSIPNQLLGLQASRSQFPPSVSYIGVTQC